MTSDDDSKMSQILVNPDKVVDSAVQIGLKWNPLDKHNIRP